MDNIREEKFGVTGNHCPDEREPQSASHEAEGACRMFHHAVYQEHKMKEARTCLANGMNVSEAAYAVGMTDPNYFTKCFKAEFNITPTEYLKSIRK